MGGSIVIDISAAVNQGAGIGRYARELTRELVRLLPPDSTRLWFALDDSPADPGLLERPPWSELPATRSRLTRRNVDRLGMRMRLPVSRLMGAGHPTDSYSPDFTTPPGRREHVTIHDLSWLNPEAQTAPELAAFLEPVVRRAIERASTVFTVSSTIRAEILDRFDLPGDRVTVAPNAAAPYFFRAEPQTHSELSRLGVKSPFLLYVGSIEPRKNLPVLFRALAILPRELSLVMVGKNGWNAERQLDPIERLGLQRRVVRLGFFSDSQLPGLYASAAAVVYPSRYEGFGLPVVEGLAAGVPVVVSDLPVFREVGGDEVTLFDPSDPRSLADGIERAISGEGRIPATRERRLTQARKFDWGASAEIVARRLQEAS